MHCENCGTEVGTDSKFCANCGSSTQGSLGRSRSPHVSTSKRHPPKLLIAFVAAIPVILLGVYLLPFESESSKIKKILQETSEQAERIHDEKIKAKEDAGNIKNVQKDTVKRECPSTQIAVLQTLGTEDGKQMVLSLTLSDGSNVKYLIKLPIADRLQAAAKGGVAKEKVSSWELEGMGTALSIGDNSLPLGVALKLAK